ncbi:hypothetical protein HOH87_05905 [bacterium]|jgi:hypothetical protein|nr:hypothetical protein [bacterium]
MVLGTGFSTDYTLKNARSDEGATPQINRPLSDLRRVLNSPGVLNKGFSDSESFSLLNYLVKGCKTNARLSDTDRVFVCHQLKRLFLWTC